MAENKFDIQQLFNDLSPEMQERARACRTKEELLQLAADEDIEIPMEALESVAGGCDQGERYCADCLSTKIYFDDYYFDYYCADCRSYNIRIRRTEQ